MNSIFHRISVRKYQEKPVEAEKIERMLRAAMAAPSACNQPVSYTHLDVYKRQILRF